MFDNSNNVARHYPQFPLINDAIWILLWVHKTTNSFNSCVLAYKVNSLMVVVAITEIFWNIDWMCDNFIIIMFMVYIVQNILGK